VGSGPDAMWSCLLDGRARVGISLTLLVIASEIPTFPILTSQAELFDVAVASAYVTLFSNVGTSLLLHIRAPADNIKSLVLGGGQHSHVMMSLQPARLFRARRPVPERWQFGTEAARIQPSPVNDNSEREVGGGLRPRLEVTTGTSGQQLRAL
jgi:hypothetical protein